MTRPGDMVDCFSLLSLPRAATLDDEVLHRAFTELSRTAHPDHGGTEAMAARVNAAYETLRSPDRRLKHLLELAGPPEAKAWRAVPLDETMMSLFSGLGRVMDATTKFLERKAKATSALAKALLAAEELQHRDTLEHIGFEIAGRIAAMEAQLPSLDVALVSDDTEAWQHLAIMQARFAYLAKWQAQVRERLLALM